MMRTNDLTYTEANAIFKSIEETRFIPANKELYVSLCSIRGRLKRKEMTRKEFAIAVKDLCSLYEWGYRE
jgi:hypothetical protein